MKKLSLNGKWTMEFDESGKTYNADVPVSDYNVLYKCGEIEDPFYGQNENDALFISEKSKTFKRDFEIDNKLLGFKNIVLHCNMLDTLAEITVNGKSAGKSQNAYVPFDAEIGELLSAGKNSIEIKFSSPVEYVKERQKQKPLPRNANGINGVPYIRKPACHFGWDWGINMPVSGILGDIEIQFFDEEIRDFEIVQHHSNGAVTLEITTDIKTDATGFLTDPDGNKTEFKIKNGKGVIEIENPRLWWTRELSGVDKQPLYSVEIGEIKKKIGLRTIELNRKADKYGNNFQFILNGVEIFAKGSNMIPPDAMADRINEESYKKIVDDAVNANFNMIRIWGGGYYGADELYDLCDERGILIWQDFMFACLMYPFYEKDFLDNVLSEVKSNVNRIKHHPSLALWCGNNEIEFMFSYMPESSEIVKWYKKFFYEILPAEIRKYDALTPYIETSPIGEGFRKNITADKCGDTHMWHVWHGSKNLQYYTKRYTRFCSEYGMESLPSEDCIATFAKPEEFDLYSKTMLHHQKCLSGNSKMKFYLLERYNEPDKFSDLIYLTGLVQAQCIANASEHWRRNKGRCNGSLWWQLNDCWGAPSWSSVDYSGKWKPLMYEARRFFAPVSVSVKLNNEKAEIFVLNDTADNDNFELQAQILDFSGNIISEKSEKVYSEAGKPKKIFTIAADKKKLNQCFVLARLYKNGDLISQKTSVFIPEKKLKLKRAKIKAVLNGNKITLSSDTFAKSVFVDIKGESTPLSDNCFDLIPNEEKTITLNKDCKITADKISVKCVNNIKSTHSKASGSWFRFTFSVKPENIANRFYYTVS